MEAAGWTGELKSNGAIAFNDFIGNWTVRRTIIDRLAKASYRFEGNATIEPSSFTETGTIRSGAMSLKGDRSYQLRRGDDGLEILFSDGRPFVALENAPVQSVYHLCGEDNYTGRFLFMGDGSWAEAWKVIGPRKHYISLAKYRRAGG